MSAVHSTGIERTVWRLLEDLPPARQKACWQLIDLMSEITGEQGVLWGEDVVGFGRFQYRRGSGSRGEWFLVGFSPRKQHWVIYSLNGFEGCDEWRQHLGRHKLGRCCLYLKDLNQVDFGALRQLLVKTIEDLDTDADDGAD
ncbi:conserved domain protein [gamma proteobacterium HTCC5015]|nr:conserved domain protein [gamma proteobacterium HTCC5015]